MPTPGDSLATRIQLAVIGPAMEYDDRALSEALAGKVVLVTGASFGQGEAFAKLAGAAGATVLLVARTAERLEEVAAEITAGGGHAVPYPLDMADLPAVDDFVERVLSEHPVIDVLVHNAGKSLRRSVYLSAQRPRDMDAMVGVNLLGPMRLTLGLLPALRAQGGAHIVNIATAGLWMTPAAPRWGFYLACKAGFDVWLRSAALETAADGVTLTTIYAGHIKSRMVATGWVSRTPGHTPEQAARVVAYAITHRPRVMAPRMMGAVRVLGAALEGPLGLALSLVDRRGGETPASAAAFARAMAKESQDADGVRS